MEWEGAFYCDRRSGGGCGLRGTGWSALVTLFTSMTTGNGSETAFVKGWDVDVRRTVGCKACM
jgi:hypothetical protein